MDLIAQADAAIPWQAILNVTFPAVTAALAGWYVWREKRHAANMEALKAKLSADATVETARGGQDNEARGKLYEQLFKLVDEHKTEIALLNAANIECEKRGDECERRDREKEIRLARLEMEFKHVNRKVNKIEESVNVPGPAPTTVNVTVGAECHPDSPEHGGLVLPEELEK